MERLREKGIKLTPQRLAIVEFLEGNRDHPTADDVYMAVRKRFPTMSHATVYNTLKTLKEHGEILELTIDPERKHYDPDTSPHHHLVCVECGDITDIPGGADVSPPEELDSRYLVIGSHVEFFGLCPDCNTESRKKRGA